MITVLAYSETTSGNCPECGHLSSRASTAGITAPSPTCPGADAASGWWCGCIASSALSHNRKTFSEALAVMAERYARRTTRLRVVLERPGHEL